jgi:hypothetical protein
MKDHIYNCQQIVTFSRKTTNKLTHADVKKDKMQNLLIEKTNLCQNTSVSVSTFCSQKPTEKQSQLTTYLPNLDLGLRSREAKK